MLVAVMLSGSSLVSQAQDIGAPPDAAASTRAALHRVTASCQRETARFCPALTETAPPRDRVICLKDYRSSLSLGCRGAINAVTR